MSSKERPSLGGTRIKTRKRNIAVPLDPTSFADAIIHIYEENKGDLDGISKALDVSDLDFSRYGDTLFEVVFAGYRMAPGSVIKEEDVGEQPWNVLSTESTRSAVAKYVTFIQKLIRRRPLLIKNLENLLRKLLQSLELYGLDDREKCATFTALVFSEKLGVPPENVFEVMLSDYLVAKGTVLTFITLLFKEFLADSTLDELVVLLKRAKVDDRLLEFFPMQKRTAEAFDQHFNSAGLEALVDYNRKKVFDVQLKDLRKEMTELISEDAPVNEVIELAKVRRKDGGLPDVDVLRVVWDSIMDAVQWSGKNQQQNINSALRQVKTWGKLLGSFATSGKVEMELMYKIQIHCYEDAKLLKCFPEIVRVLYEVDVLAEDTIMHWYRKGTNPKGRQVFVKGLEPFVKWLEEAEEEED